MPDKAIPAAGNGRVVPGRTLPAEADSETVSVVVMAEPDGVTVDGEKLHDALVGWPVHAKDVWAAKPVCGVIVTVADPFWPDAILMDDGEIEIVKVGCRLMVYAAVATSLSESPLAVAMALMVSELPTEIAPLYCVEVDEGVLPSVV